MAKFAGLDKDWTWAGFGAPRLKEALPKARRGERQRVARETGIDPGSISRYCSGESAPGLEELVALSLHLGIATDLLLGLRQPGHPDEVRELVRKFIHTAGQAADAAQVQAQALKILADHLRSRGLD